VPFRDKILITIVLVVLSALAWAATVYQAGSMGLGFITCSMTMDMPFSWSNAVLYVVLWGVMMAAMMLPSVAPMVMLFSTIARNKREQGAVFTSAWLFVAGYVGLWTLTGGVAYASDLAIQSLPHTFPQLRTYGTLIGGSTLILAGLYQLTPLKYLCLTQCRSPWTFLLSSWRDGYSGAFRMGVHHGAYCLGCCWSLMAVFFVVGSMNVLWMAILTLVIFLEKIVPHGAALGKGAGLALIGLGLLLIVSPNLEARNIETLTHAPPSRYEGRDLLLWEKGDHDG
jgi:predicted metal-binding membrane protein